MHVRSFAGALAGAVMLGCWCGFVSPAAAQSPNGPERVPGARAPVGPSAVQRGAAGPVRPGEPPTTQALPPQVPPWVPLMTPQHIQYVQQILQYWENRTAKVTRYQCRFQRWEYDPVFGPKDEPRTYSEGMIKYQAPDKGMFEVEKILFFQPAPHAGEKPTWVERPPDEFGQHWICDGKSVFEKDFRLKRLIQRDLPPEMQGQSIINGPLPFLFGGKANDIQNRFWIRVITPPDRKGEYWLEAVPKTMEDSQSFKMVHVIIDEKEFLPVGMVMYDRNFQPDKPARTVFQFKDRNENFTLDQLILWKKAFYEPELPKDWRKVVYRYGGLPPDGPAGAAGPVTAERPGNSVAPGVPR